MIANRTLTRTFPEITEHERTQTLIFCKVSNTNTCPVLIIEYCEHEHSCSFIPAHKVKRRFKRQSVSQNVNVDETGPKL